MTLFKLGEVNKAAGKLAEALQCFQESLEIERGLASNSSPLVRRRHNSQGLDSCNGKDIERNWKYPLNSSKYFISGQHAYAIEFSFLVAEPAA